MYVLFREDFFGSPSLVGGWAWTHQKWNLQKSACDDGVKNELRLVLAKIGANLSFPGLKMLLNGL